MDFGGNKNIIKKIIVAFAIMFFVFGSFIFDNNIVEAQEETQQITEQQRRDCTERGRYSTRGGNCTLTREQWEASRGIDSRPAAELNNRNNNPTENQSSATEKKEEIEKCGWTNMQGCINNFIKSAFTVATNSVISVVGLVLRAAAFLLNGVIDITILKMSDFIGDDSPGSTGEGIKSAWLIFRDILNILFIFGLLYISIKKIVGGLDTGSRKLLANVIMAALLVNFSFFITSVLIDASNFLTIEIYDQLDDCLDGESNAIGFTDSASYGGIATCFTDKLKLTTTLDNNVDGIAKELNPENEISLDEGIFSVYIKSLLGAILGSVFILITAFVFISLAIMLIIRFVLLIILLITSPVMFLGWVLPKFQNLSEMWRKSMVENLLWVPFSFLFLLITLLVLKSINLVGGSLFSNIINYLIVTVFIIASIMVAKKLGAKGAERATRYGGFLTTGLAARGAASGLGFAGRNIIGRGAAGIADNLKGRNSRFAKFAQTRLEGVANRSFDLRNTGAFQGVASSTGINAGTGATLGYQQRIDQKAQQRQEEYNNAGEMTQDERREIAARTRNIQQNEDTQRDLETINGNNKSIEANNEKIERLNKEKGNFNKDSEEYRTREAETTRLQQENSETRNEIQQIEEQIEARHREDMQAIKDLEDRGEARREEFLTTLGNRTSGQGNILTRVVNSFDRTSNTQAVAAISAAENKEWQKVVELTKNRGRIADRSEERSGRENQNQNITDALAGSGSV